MEKLSALIQTFGAVCSALLVIGTIIATIFKLPAKFLKKMYTEHVEKIVDEKVAEVTKMLETIKTESEDNRAKISEATKASLRHSITYIYEKYKDEKILPGNTKNDLCSLYEAYTLLNGNSYIHEIYEEMMKWNTK